MKYISRDNKYYKFIWRLILVQIMTTLICLTEKNDGLLFIFIKVLGLVTFPDGRLLTELITESVF